MLDTNFGTRRGQTKVNAVMSEERMMSSREGSLDGDDWWPAPPLPVLSHAPQTPGAGFAPTCTPGVEEFSSIVLMGRGHKVL